MIEYIALSVMSIALWLVLAAFFSGTETGMYCMNKFRLGAQAASRNKNALRLQSLLKRPGDLVCTLLIGTNLSIYIATAECTELIGSLGIAHNSMIVALVTTVVLGPFVLLFAEMVPKEIFRRCAGTLAYSSSRSVYAFYVLFRLPVVMLRGVLVVIEKISGMDRKKEDLLFNSREELADLITVGAREGVISRQQADMARKAMQLRRVKLSDVMIPLNQVTMVEADTAVGNFLSLARGRRHSRILVFDRVRIDVVGVVNIFDIFYDPDRGDTVGDYVESVVKFSYDALAPQALPILQHRKRMMALVVGEDEKPVGIVTVKDIVEEIAGEISDW